MEKGFEAITKKMAESITGRFYVAFLDDDGNILYSSLLPESVETLKKLIQVFAYCEVGDFQVKRLTKSNLLVYKVSPHTVLALESYAKEGVLIAAAKHLEENYADLFREPEDRHPAPQVQEVSEKSSEEPITELVQEVSSTVTEETEKITEAIPREDKDLKEIRERLEKIDNLIKKRKRKLTRE
nr:hypothetical protein [Candidatus Freyarchaeota archaeon]